MAVLSIVFLDSGVCSRIFRVNASPKSKRICGGIETKDTKVAEGAT